MTRLGTALLQKTIVLSSMRVAVVVGLLLNVINQGSVFLHGEGINWGQVVLNFVVPYCVASYSAARHDLERSKNE